MSREIRFRGWCSDNGDYMMVYYEKMELDNGLWFSTDGKHTGEIHEIMQFTGLKDHNRKEIYEGDILSDSSKFTWVVSWNDNHACFMVTSQTNNVVAEVIDNENMTVVGNIYEK